MTETPLPEIQTREENPPEKQAPPTGILREVFYFCARNGILFLAVSVYAKIVLLYRLKFNWFAYASDSPSWLHAFSRLFTADFETAAVVFAIAFPLMAAAYRLKLGKPAAALAYGFQGAYFIYCLAYVEFYMEYRTLLTLTPLMQAQWMVQIAGKTVMTIIYSVDWISIAVMSIATAITGFLLLPAAERTIRNLNEQASFRTLFALALLVSPLVYLYLVDRAIVLPFAPPYQVGQAKSTSGYGLELNPLNAFLMSAYNRGMFYSLDYHGYGDDPKRPHGHTMLIDPKYPLMTGTEYAVCSEPKLSNNPIFRTMCHLDEDGDGLTKMYDPDDHNATVKAALGVMPRKNVVLIILEGQDAATMQLYDPALNNTPNLVSYRNISFVARKFYSNVGSSLRGEFMIYCSMYPYEDLYSFNLMPLFEVPCLPDILANNGYRTEYFISTDIDFGERKASIGRKSWGKYISTKDIPTDGFFQHYWGWEDKVMLKPFLQWVDSDQTKPFFAILRCTIGHPPITLPKGYDAYTSSQQNVALYSDSFIGDVMQSLGERGLLEDTVVVIVSDHSSDQKRFDMDRIPFIMVNPNLFKGGLESSEPASQLDLAPTIMEALGVQSINSFQGKSLYREPEYTDRNIFFTLETGLLGVRHGDMLYKYDINTRITTFANNANASMANPEAAETLYNSLVRWHATYKQLYLERRLFDQRLIRTRPVDHKLNASCWPFEGELTAYQWAENANASSWDTSRGEFTPLYATGIPDRPPVKIFLGLPHESWAPNTTDEGEWLETYYANPKPAESIIVCKGNQEPTINSLELIDVGGGYHNLTEWGDKQARTWRIDVAFNRTGYRLKGVRINTGGAGVTEIDAIGIR